MKTVKCVPTVFDIDRKWQDNTPLQPIPVPIDDKLVLDCITEQLPTGEEGTYARMVKLDIETITQLKIEYKSIPVIENLGHLVSLVKLQLCNNVIEKIQNLDTLVNLTWLDLSFNCIKKIEGLDNLKKIEVLDLHRNWITTLENMDNLLSLQIFHISSNKLDNYENVKYLRRFLRLRSVGFVGNPISKNPSFYSYLIAFVPQLAMVDYKLIPSREREISDAKYKAQVDKHAASEDHLIKRASVVEEEEKLKQLHQDAFIDVFQEDALWNLVFENDSDGHFLMRLSDTKEVYERYKDYFLNTTKKMFKKGLKFYQMRKNEMDAYNTAVTEELREVQKEGNEMTEEFVEFGRSALADIKMLVSLMEESDRKLQHGLVTELPEEFFTYQSQLHDLVREYVRKLHTVWSTLINTEMEYTEEAEEINDLLDESVHEIIQDWVEILLAQFTELRKKEKQLFENLYDELIENEDSTSDSLKEIMGEENLDKEGLYQIIKSSYKKHLEVIGNLENDLCQKLKNFLDDFAKKLQADEYYRNRARLEETSHFTNYHYKLLEETKAFPFCTQWIPGVREDQNCWDPDDCYPLEWYEKLTKKIREKEKYIRKLLGIPLRKVEKAEDFGLAPAPAVSALKGAKGKKDVKGIGFSDKVHVQEIETRQERADEEDFVL